MGPKIFSQFIVAAILSCGYFSVSSQSDASASRGIVRYVEHGRYGETQLYDSSYALVIGMSKYQNPAWPRLDGPESDVKEVKSVLRNHGFVVETEMDVTGEALERRIEKFLKDYGLDGKQRRIIVYFAGHGHTMKADDGRDMGYIVPIDAPNPETDALAFKKIALNMEKLKAFARSIEAKHALFLFDSCFSGLLTTRSETRVVPRLIAQALDSPSRHFITSGSQSEKVPDQSTFRRALVGGLQGDADMDKNGYITGSELFNHVSARVVNAKDSSQTPQSGKIEDANWKGDMVFFLQPDGTDANLEQAWQEVNAEKSVSSISKFITRFPASKYHNEAVRLWVELDTKTKTEAKVETGQTSAAPSPLFRGSALTLSTFEFSTVNVDASGSASPKITSKTDAVEQDLGGGIKLVLARVPGDTFSMGSTRSDDEKPVHKVTIGEFYIGVHEVTKKQWEAVRKLDKVNIDMPKNPSGGSIDDLPITNISWDHAREFCERLSKLTSLRYSLPSESEWEYAARAGTKTPFAFGTRLQPDYVNFDAGKVSNHSLQGPARGKSVAVGSLGVANLFGLFDMHGNVSEWCEDGWSNNYEGAFADGSARGGSTKKKVVRGGSFNLMAADLCSTCRSSEDADIRIETVGFRVVMRTPVSSKK